MIHEYAPYALLPSSSPQVHESTVFHHLTPYFSHLTVLNGCIDLHIDKRARATNKEDIITMAEENNKRTKRMSREEIENIINNMRIESGSTTKLLKYRGEPSEFIKYVDVKFVVQGEEEDDRKEIGSAHLAIILGNVAKYTYGQSLFEVFDCESQDLCDIFQALFNDDEEWKDEVSNKEVTNFDMLYVDYIYLHPEYRGYGLGELLLSTLIEEFCENLDIIVVWPIPITVTKEGGHTCITCEHDKKAVIAKLMNTCKRMGFTSAPKTKTPIMFLSPGLIHKTVLHAVKNLLKKPATKPVTETPCNLHNVIRGSHRNIPVA